VLFRPAQLLRPVPVLVYVTVTRMTRLRAIGLLCLVAGCVAEQARIDVLGHDLGDLHFRVSQDADTAAPVRSLIGFTVTRYPCGQSVDSGSVVWALRVLGGVSESGAPLTIAYGRSPPGYKNESGPKPLSDGCYEVYMLGANIRGFRDFEIQDDSVVVNGRPAQVSKR